MRSLRPLPMRTRRELADHRGRGSASRQVAWISLALTISLIASACSSGGASSAPPKKRPAGDKSPVSSAVTVAVTPTQATDATIGAISVHVPAHGVDHHGKLVGMPATGQVPPLPDGLVFASQPVQLELSGANLVKNVSITARTSIPPDAQATATMTPIPGSILAYYNEAAGVWSPVSSTAKKVGVIAFSSDHFSLWSTITLDASKIADAAKATLLGYLGVANVADPTCDGTPTADLMGVKVTSDSGDLVKWCYGANSQDGPTLTLESNRNYPLEVTYPDSWTPHTVGESDPVFQHLLDKFTTFVSSAPAGRKILILEGAHTVWFDTPPGSVGELSVEPSVLSSTFDGILYGVKTFVMTLGKIPGISGVDPSGAAKAVDLMFTRGSCLNEVNKLAVTDVHDVSGATAVFRSAASLATDCLKNVWQLGFGVAGATKAFAAGVVLWLLDGVKLVLAAPLEIVDSAIYWRSYRVHLDATTKTDAALLAKFVGTWGHHGMDMDVAADGTVVVHARTYYPCSGEPGFSPAITTPADTPCESPFTTPVGTAHGKVVASGGSALTVNFTDTNWPGGLPTGAATFTYHPEANTWVWGSPRRGTTAMCPTVPPYSMSTDPELYCGA
jgi:hypothetical protein